MPPKTSDLVLSMLKLGDYVSGEEICETLELTRAAVWKGVERLRHRGYIVKAATNRGYCLVSAPDELTEGIINLFRKTPLRPLRVYDELEGSTNTKLKALADSHPCGAAVVADGQTGGRGRLGRAFHSPSGAGIYLSVLLKAPWPQCDMMGLTTLAAVAVRAAIEEMTGLAAGIKWVNDLMVADRKLAGILTETSLDFESGEMTSAVLGIGINCHKAEYPPELQGLAISIEEATGQKPSRARLIARILDKIDEMMALDRDGCNAYMTEYRRHCVTVGRKIDLRQGNLVRPGEAIGLSRDGALVVRFEDGHTENVQVGEASLHKGE